MTAILLWLLKKKCFPRKLLQGKNKKTENEVRPSKRRNLNPRIVPEDVDRSSEISQAQILNIDSKMPEYFKEFLSEELFSEIGKNIFQKKKFIQKYGVKTYFYPIFLLGRVFSKKYENLSWETITSWAQKRIQQEKAKNLNGNDTQEKVDENFSSKLLVKKPRGRPRKSLLRNLRNIPSQPKRKRGIPRKQIYEDELPEINMQKGSPTKVESDSDFDPDYLDYLKKTQAKNKKKNAKKPKNINGFESEESENYFSTSEDEINYIKTSYEGNDGENK